MRYYSLNHNSSAVSFKEATIRGQAPDKGLYFPESIPVLPSRWIKKLPELSKLDIALRVIEPYIGSEIPASVLEQIVSQTIDFDFPLIPVNKQIFSLELFHGPTLAFKDVGARFMSRCLGYLVKNEPRKLTVLVATSGDTGGAVADGFHGVDNIEVIILYPAGKVSGVQELQLTTYGDNIWALEVEGSFDDCQRMVKQAFVDPQLTGSLFLTSANSINVARWLPQQFYYFFALRSWMDLENPPVISVPSGNFGNLCAGLLAQISGLPVAHFIAACNANDVVPSFLQSGQYLPKPSISTLSNAMDVGDPSNFIRILELFGKQFHTLQQAVSAYSVSDEQTLQTIGQVWSDYHYLTDPHGAVAFLALERWLQAHRGQRGLFLETAHPVKFPAAVERITGQAVPVPERMAALFTRTRRKVSLGADYQVFKDYLLAKK
jgi:threonine synthase